MRLRDYLLGRRIVLQSPKPRAKVAERINASTGSFFSPFGRGVTGGVYLGRVYLAWSIPMFSNGFRPMLSGRLIERGRFTELRASFGAPVFLQVFLAIWYAIFTFVGVGTAVSLLREGWGTRDPWAILTIPLMALVPLVFHLIFNRNADAHCDAILVMLQHEAGLEPVGSSRGP